MNSFKYYNPVNIAGVLIPGNLFFAPIAGYSDAACRSICIENGADFCYTEMVSAEALIRSHEKTKVLMARAKNEKLYSIQLFGSNPDSLAEACKIASEFNPTVIDLNCGCPVPKIVKAGSGSALMRTPDLLSKIVSSMSKAVTIPITVKFRLGWDASSINYPDIAQVCIDSGAKALTLHARTRAQGYSGKADWSALKNLVAISSVPVFGSGDVFMPSHALSMIEETNCAGIMIARGAIGNPFIFSQSKCLLEGKSFTEPSATILAATMLKHITYAIELFGEKTACTEFRKHFCTYTKGYTGGAELRKKAVSANTLNDYKTLLEELSQISSQLIDRSCLAQGSESDTIDL